MATPRQHRLVMLVALAVAILVIPSVAVAQDADADPLPAPGTLLEPGRYRTSAVGPTIDFRAGEGWITSGPSRGPIFSLERADPPGTVLTVTRFDGAAFVDSCDATSLTNVETSVPRLIEIIAGNPYLNPAPPAVTEVDGHVGLILDVATPEFDECGLPYLLIWAVSIEDGEFVQVAGQQARFIALDVAGDTIVIAIESFPGVPFGTLLDASMDLVDSMRIEPGEYAPTDPSPAPSPSPTPETAQPDAGTPA